MEQFLFWLNQILSWSIVTQCWWIVHQTGAHKGKPFFSGVSLMRVSMAGLGIGMACVASLLHVGVSMELEPLWKGALAVMLLGVILFHKERFQKL